MPRGEIMLFLPSLVFYLFSLQGLLLSLYKQKGGLESVRRKASIVSCVLAMELAQRLHEDVGLYF